MQITQICNKGAVGCGSKPTAGLADFTVSNLIPGFEQPWETDFERPAHIASALDIMLEGLLGASAFERVLCLPSIGSKSFLITIGDHTITGLITQDQMVRPWQVPVAVTRSSYGFNVLTAANVGDLGCMKLSANWMCAMSMEDEGAALYDAVKAVGLELCPVLGVGIPVGKDSVLVSMSMLMKWREGTEKREVNTLLSLIVMGIRGVQNAQVR
ncbi:PurM, N-terminal-like protein [Trametes gibbosa]|nr:PurM, N-terminal-like protein [Trametes gibbosa]